MDKQYSYDSAKNLQLQECHLSPPLRRSRAQFHKLPANRMRGVYKAEVTLISLYGVFGDLNKYNVQLALVNHGVFTS